MILAAKIRTKFDFSKYLTVISIRNITRGGLITSCCFSNATARAQQRFQSSTSFVKNFVPALLILLSFQRYLC